MTLWIILSLAAWLVITFLMLGFFRSASRADERLQAYHREMQSEPKRPSVTPAEEKVESPDSNVAKALE